MPESDVELLQLFTRNESQDAFAMLVKRHLDLVYSAALRQVHSPHLAEEVAQSVFTDLAREASHLNASTILIAWLYQVTRRTAIDVVRRESRRQARERLAVEMTAMNEPSSDWSDIKPLLDEAMESLEELDRTAILMRYFEKKPLREIGALLGTSDDAAQKRVTRAVERLRVFFQNYGVRSGTSAVALAIAANSVQAAPTGLAAMISTGALSSLSIATSATTATAKALAMTTIQKTCLAATLVACVGTGLYQTYHSERLRDRLQALEQQRAPLIAQMQQLQRERDEATNRAASLAAEVGAMHTDASELVKLRRQVTELRGNMPAANPANDPFQSAAKSWAERVSQLKQRLDQTQGAAIPEFKYLAEANWLNAAREPLLTEEDYRRAFASLRSAAENQFIILMQKALGTYLKQSSGQFPSDPSQLKPFFEASDDASLRRYAIVPASTIPNLVMGGDHVITVASPIDKEYDTLWALGPSGFGSTTYTGQNDASALIPAMKAYQAANNGQEPKDPSALVPFLSTPEQQAAYQKLEQRRSAQVK